MARFIKITEKDGDMLLINTHYVVEVEYRDCFNDVSVVVLKGDILKGYNIDFETKAEAMKFMESNFLLFNS